LSAEDMNMPLFIKSQLKADLHSLLANLHSLYDSIGERDCCVLNDFEKMNKQFKSIHSFAASYYLQSYLEPFTDYMEMLTASAQQFSEKRHGALIAMKRKDNLEDFVHSGITLNAQLSSNLLEAIFYPGNPLHDGGVLIDKDMIVSAANIFPTSQFYNGKDKLGTRHRAAIGITEQTDALVIVVSEETGRISFSIDGQLFPVQTSTFM